MMKKPYKILTLLPLLMTFAAAPAISQNSSFYLKPLDIDQDAPATLEFMLDNKEEQFYGFQADITLPAGLIYNVDSLSLNPYRFDSSYQKGMKTNLSGNVLHIAVYSSSLPQPAIEGNSGALFTWPMTTKTDFEGGTVYINNIIFVEENDRDRIFDDTETPIGVLPNSISLSPEKFTLFKGYEGFNTDTIRVSYTPDTKYTVRNLEWSISDGSIATVDPETKGDNEAKAVGEGTATITAISVNPNKPRLISAQCEVEVKDPDVGLYLTAENLTLEKGSTETAIKALVIYGESPDPGNIEWEIEQPEDAEVIRLVETEPVIREGATEQTCTISAIDNGSATIIARYKDSANDLVATCKVEVNTYVKEIMVEPVKTLRIGDTHELEYEIIPEDAINTEVTWTSGDESIATVDSEGKITAIGLGEVVITGTCATYSGYTSDSFTLKVLPVLPESITITTDKNDNPIESLIVFIGREVQLIATVAPDNTTDKTVTWTSSNPEVARIDQTGKLKAETQGKTTITATCGDVSKTCEIQVTPIQVDEITLDPTSVVLMVGGSVRISAMLEPENATDKTVIWTSSNPEIATVDDEGNVAAIALGNAEIIASAGITSAVCKVSVIPTPAESVTLLPETAELKVGESVELTATVLPEDTTYPTVTWTSNDETVATVDENGVVTAIALGDAIITASCGEPKAECKVTVVPTPAESITLLPETAELRAGESVELTATVLPEDTTYPTVTWTSGDETVATVDTNGKVTAVKIGEATITASCGDLSAECVITVVRTPVTGISLTNTELLIKVGRIAEVAAIVHPSDATDPSVVWSSSDESIATVDSDGNITGIGAGVAIITVTSVSDPEISAQCTVTVEPDIIPVTNMTISDTELTLIEEDTYTLSATVTPEDATDQTVTWRSSDLSVAVVAADGTVTAIAPGNAIIYASSSNGLTVECALTVIAKIIYPTGISLSNYDLLMREGHTAEIYAVVHPNDVTDPTVTWTSSDESIATVEDKGNGTCIITAVKQGNATITATTVNGLTALCNVTVVPVITAVEKIEVNPESLEMIEGDEATLTATVTPGDATDKTVTWKSSNKDIVTVSENGEVKAIAAGEATIYVSSSNGLTVECKVTVKPREIPVTGISLSNTELLMRKGYTAELIAIVRPDNATDKRVTWSSNDESIVTVDDNGIVTANAVGSAKIIVTSVYDTSIKAECKVTVEEEHLIVAVTDISLSDSEIELEVDDTYTLIATITPDDATDKTVTWKSSDRAVATVDETGVVTAVSPGVAIIYASSSNGLTAECKVTVVPGIIEVQSISLSNTELLMREGHTAELIAIVRPDDATDKNVIWSTNAASIATVDDKGIVTAVKQGYATITAASANGVKAECFVTVVPDIIAVEKIEVNPVSLEMTEGDTFALTATVTPDDATDKTVTWISSDRAVAIVSADGVITATGVGNAKIYASSSNGLTAECDVTVLPRVIEVTSISLDESILNLFVGQSATLTALIMPEDATDKSVTWFSNNPDIVEVEDGVVTGLKVGLSTITAKSSNGKNAYCAVNVMDRPLTPEQLLKKGDGTTCTFVIMMGISDEELAEKGYRFAVGYTDSEGQSSIIAETPLRYCHTTPEIYNNPSNDFWTFAFIENEEGEILTSNLRHLDGREEMCFDASKYGFRGNLPAINELIMVTPTAIHITASSCEDMDIAVYTPSGILLYYKSYKGKNEVADVIELDRFASGTYVVAVSCDGNMETKKIVVR